MVLEAKQIVLPAYLSTKYSYNTFRGKGSVMQQPFFVVFKCTLFLTNTLFLSSNFNLLVEMTMKLLCKLIHILHSILWYIFLC